MIVKLLTEHHLEFLSLKGGCRGSSESTHVKMPHCWKSHALAHICITFQNIHYIEFDVLHLSYVNSSCPYEDSCSLLHQPKVGAELCNLELKQINKKGKISIAFVYSIIIQLLGTVSPHDVQCLVSCKANCNRNQLDAWLNSDLIVE